MKNLLYLEHGSEAMGDDNIIIDFGQGTGEESQHIEYYYGIEKEYSRGEYIIKIKYFPHLDIRFLNLSTEVEVIQWGSFGDSRDYISNITKINE